MATKKSTEPAATTEDDVAQVYSVHRQHGCLAIYGSNPPPGDLHALLRQWSDYHEPRMRWSSLGLARRWGAVVVVCENSGHEAQVIREWDHAETRATPAAANPPARRGDDAGGAADHLAQPGGDMG
jgi:hypothetical protein